MNARKVKYRDIKDWAAMRSQLWPESRDGYRAELQAYFAGNPIGISEAFVLELNDKNLAGFIELNIRNCVEGTEANAVPYIEAWFVSEQYRGQGFGKKLIEFAELWALKKGYSELASDAEISNLMSIEAHEKLGFQAVAKIVCFHKKLRDQG